MASMYTVAVSVLIVLQIAKVASSGVCVDSLHELESSLKENPFNIESIDNGFNPPNTHQPLWVDVHYYYNATDSMVLVHPDSYQGRNTTATPNSTFQWVISQLFLPMGPQVVELLSGAFISLQPGTVHIVIKPICGNDTQHHLDLLNRLTVKVFSHIRNSDSTTYCIHYIVFIYKFGALTHSINTTDLVELLNLLS